MAIERESRPPSKFTNLSNSVIGDLRMSFKARGILAYILSKPDLWVVRAEELAKAGKCGRDAILNGLKEIEEAGYLVRITERDNKGRWIHKQVVREKSIFDGVANEE